MSWLLVGGAAIGAGVGQLAGGNTKSTLTGAGIGLGAAFGAGALGFGAGAGAGSTGTALTAQQTAAMAGGAGPLLAEAASSVAASGTASSLSMAGFGGTAVKTTAGAGFLAGLTKPMIGNAAFTSPLMLASLGMGLAGAQGSSGPSFEKNIPMSPEGKKMEAGYFAYAKDKMSKAKAGSPGDTAFQDISNAKVAEGNRNRASQGGFAAVQGGMYNASKDERGTPTVGGKMIKAGIADSGERMKGLFGPRSILGNYQRQELMNATAMLQNADNLSKQTASFNYGSQLAGWQSNQMMQANRGQAYGEALSSVGDAQMMQTYLSLKNTKINA